MIKRYQVVLFTSQILLFATVPADATINCSTTDLSINSYLSSVFDQYSSSVAVNPLNEGDEGETKYCRLREAVYAREIWNFWAGYKCYNYTNDARMNCEYQVVPGKYNDLTIPVTSVTLTNGTPSYFWYDYHNETSLEFLQLSFRNKLYLDLWKECAQEAEECCYMHMTNENIYPDESHPCPQIWDAWSCFAPAKDNTVSKKSCPQHAYSTQAKVCILFSEKYCFDGQWNQNTNYVGTCSRAPIYKNRHNFHVICLSVAICISFPAAVIFLYFRKLRNNTRIILHRNLLLVIIVRSILTIMSKEIVILDNLKSTDETNHVMEDNGVACRVLAFFEGAAKNAMYACMLMDGFYLHKLIVRSFAKEPSLSILYGITAALAFIPSLVWAILRSVHDGRDCWMVDEVGGGDQWVLDIFRIVILVLNVLLLVDIIRVMVLKLRKSTATTSTSKQTQATFRATLFLMPLFGIHIIIITNRNIVPDDTCTSEDVYLYVSYVLESIQGIVVSILFCYLSAEVHAEISNEFRKLAIYVQQRYGWNIRRQTVARRRTTAATYVDPLDPADNNNSNKSKIYRDSTIFQDFKISKNESDM